MILFKECEVYAPEKLGKKDVLLAGGKIIAFEDKITMPAELGKTRYRLTVEDNGQGFPSHVDAKAGETTGLAIIHAMAERLSGSLEVNSEKGTSVSLVFICSEVG